MNPGAVAFFVKIEFSHHLSELQTIHTNSEGSSEKTSRLGEIRTSHKLNG